MQKHLPYYRKFLQLRHFCKIVGITKRFNEFNTCPQIQRHKPVASEDWNLETGFQWKMLRFLILLFCKRQKYK